MRRSWITLANGLIIGSIGSGCGSNFTAESVVESLRILGVQSQPADLHPGESATLQGLVTDPNGALTDRSAIWFFCDPDPFNLNRSACSDTSTLSNSLLATSTDQRMDLPPGMHLIGVTLAPSFTIAAELFSPLQHEDPRRITGTVAEILVIAVGASLPPLPTLQQLRGLLDRVKARSVPSVTGLFRVRISEDPQRNHNPQLGRLIADGRSLPQGAVLRLNFGTSISLDVEVSDDSFEEYDQLTPTGIEHKQERLIASYYTTLGQFTNDRISLRSGTIASLRLPSDTIIVPSRRGRLWVVVRDTRGGVSWIEVPAFVCDPARATPRVSSLQAQIRAGGVFLVLRGERLDEILEVWVDAVPLRNSQATPSGQTFSGTAGALENGPPYRDDPSFELQ